MWTLIGYAVGVVFGYFFIVFLIAQWRRDNSLVDVAWGLGFAIVSLFTFFAAGHYTARSIIVLVLVLIWGLRLSYHIARRNWGQPEDFRYAQWRKEWGRWVVPRAFLQVFMLQALFQVIIVYPVLLAQVSPRGGFGPVVGFGLALWGLGFLFEVVGDRQLRAFKRARANRGKLLTTGLWKYTRHPNYFGEATMWWGLAVIAAPVSWGWTGVISPLTITYLLRFVSGVPMLERKYRGRPDFEAYARVTNAFFPWFPKKPPPDERR